MANFDKSRYQRLNKNHLTCGRLLNVILLIFLIITYVEVMLANIAQQYNPLTVILFYYSGWGVTVALFSMIFSIIAAYKKNWFRLAYISVEVSYAINTTVFLAFWLIIWPKLNEQFDQLIENTKDSEKKKEVIALVANLKLYQTALHFLPWATTVINLIITDMTLHKSHWWIAVIVVFPCYALANLAGSLWFGQHRYDGKVKFGTIYGVE